MFLNLMILAILMLTLLYPRQFFSLKITVLGELSCVALSFCCVVLPCLLSEHFIDDVSHVYTWYGVWRLCWFDYRGLLLIPSLSSPVFLVCDALVEVLWLLCIVYVIRAQPAELLSW